MSARSGGLWREQAQLCPVRTESRGAAYASDQARRCACWMFGWLLQRRIVGELATAGAPSWTRRREYGGDLNLLALWQYLH